MDSSRHQPGQGKCGLPDRERGRQKIILSPHDLWRLVGALKLPYKVIVMLAVFSGPRKDELAALRRNDVGSAGLKVDEAVDRAVLGPAKTERSTSTVAIGPIIRKALEEGLPMAKFTGRDDFLFGNRTNTRFDLQQRRCSACEARTAVWDSLRFLDTTCVVRTQREAAERNSKPRRCGRSLAIPQYG